MHPRGFVTHRPPNAMTSHGRWRCRGRRAIPLLPTLWSGDRNRHLGTKIGVLSYRAGLGAQTCQKPSCQWLWVAWGEVSPCHPKNGRERRGHESTVLELWGCRSRNVGTLCWDRGDTAEGMGGSYLDVLHWDHQDTVLQTLGTMCHTARKGSLLSSSWGPCDSNVAPKVGTQCHIHVTLCWGHWRN